KISKNDADDEKDRQRAAKQIVDEYLALHNVACTDKPSLIVWPETSYPDDWWELSQDFLDKGLEEVRRQYQAAGRLDLVPSWEDYRQWAFKRLNERMVESAGAWPTEVLLGLNTEVYSEFPMSEHSAKRRYNSAVLLHPGGKFGGRYDQIH